MNKFSLNSNEGLHNQSWEERDIKNKRDNLLSSKMYPTSFSFCDSCVVSQISIRNCTKLIFWALELGPMSIYNHYLEGMSSILTIRENPMKISTAEYIQT